jgi:hypothetical protein
VVYSFGQSARKEKKNSKYINHDGFQVIGHSALEQTLQSRRFKGRGKHS